MKSRDLIRFLGTTFGMYCSPSDHHNDMISHDNLSVFSRSEHKHTIESWHPKQSQNRRDPQSSNHQRGHRLP